jgi:hypothetical protein
MPAITYFVVQAFDLSEEGNLVPREALPFTSAESARRAAVVLEADAAGVIAFARTAYPDIGEYSEPTIILKAGTVPKELE